MPVIFFAAFRFIFVFFFFCPASLFFCYVSLARRFISVHFVTFRFVSSRVVSGFFVSFRVVLFRFVSFSGDEGHPRLGEDTPASGRAGPSPVDAYPGTILYCFFWGGRGSRAKSHAYPQHPAGSLSRDIPGRIP